MTEDELDNLFDIFYSEAPYDYVLTIKEKAPPKVRGWTISGYCDYTDKMVVLFMNNSYLDSLDTIMHELAHANIQHRTHSDVWEKEYIRLVRKYEIPQEIVGHNDIIGPNAREYING